MEPSPFSARADLGFAWSVKDSFLQYIRGMNDGNISWRDGAAVANTGQFYFPLVGTSSCDEVTTLQFRGEVLFTAHRGLLSVSLSQPSIHVGHHDAELFVRVGDTQHLIGLVDLPPRILDGDVAMWMDAQARLSESGAEMFGGSYSAGEQLAPLTIRIPASALEEN